MSFLLLLLLLHYSTGPGGGCRLHGCRAIFLRDDNKDGTSTASTILLDNVEEIIAWLQFVGYDLKTFKAADLRHSIQLRELLLVLGANLAEESDHELAAAFRLAPGWSA